MSQIDQDFEKIAAQINAKLKEAAEAVREANRLGDEAGLPGLIYTQWTAENLGLSRRNEGDRAKLEEIEEKLELINVRDLESALGGAGWSTSSSYC